MLLLFKFVFVYLLSVPILSIIVLFKFSEKDLLELDFLKSFLKSNNAKRSSSISKCLQRFCLWRFRAFLIFNRKKYSERIIKTYLILNLTFLLSLV